MKGQKVQSVEQVCSLAYARRSVMIDGWNAPVVMPAAVVQNMQVAVVVRMVELGMWVYEKAAKKERKWK